MEDNSRFDKGFENRKEVLGPLHVEKSWANADEFNRPMQKLVTEYAWGEIWGDPTLTFKTRSMLNIGMLTAMSQHQERRHEGRDSRRADASRRVLRRAPCARGLPGRDRCDQGLRSRRRQGLRSDI
jgi:4-carboxymuconolactone decarboxylase